jgi:hypothetical protein
MGEAWREITVNFACKVSFSYSANGFTSPPKEVVDGIVIALKNPLSLAGFEPAKLGHNGKRDYH